jgi:cellobiose dehydrogenase (acceptor)
MNFILTTLITGFLLSAASAAPVTSSQNSTDWKTQQWDVIVVGAGPAGIIVADRLSEAGKKTLLLEQGSKSYGVVGGTEKPDWLGNTSLSRVDVPGLCMSTQRLLLQVLS